MTVPGRAIAVTAARIAHEKRADQVIVYDLRQLSDVFDYFVIATGQSKAQIRAIVEELRLRLKKSGEGPLSLEGFELCQWVLLDYVDCVIHLFSPRLREYYALESLWGDAPQVDWADPGEPFPDVAAAGDSA